MKTKDSFNITGHVKIYSGIPKGIYSEEKYLSFPEKYCLIEPKLLYDDHNLITAHGKESLLHQTIRELTIATSPMTVNYMAVGDGGYDFANSSKLYPASSDLDLTNLLQRIQITSFVEQDPSSSGAFSTIMATTFFSSGSSEEDFSSSNIGHYINEAGLYWKDDSDDYHLFARITTKNYPFDPAMDFAITYNWSIVFS